MNWTEQAETMAKTWAEAQKKMWENWYNLSQAASKSAPFNTGLVDQWREMAGQGFEAWMANAEPTAKDTARRLFAGQEAFTRFLQFSADAWQSLAAKAASGENWQEALAQYSEQLRQELLQSPQKMLNMSQDTGELWRLYMEEMQKLAQPWLQSWQQSNGSFGKAMRGDGLAMMDLLNHYQDAYEHTFGHLLESPSLGYTRELNEKMLKGFDAWQALHEINFEYQLLLTDAWIKAFEKFQLELVEQAEKEAPITSLEQLANKWYDVADNTFIEIFRSEKYIRTQGQLLSATLTYRLRQREIVELFLKINDLPTRTEVDEAHRNIYLQRKELKALKKTVTQLSGRLDNVANASQVASQSELASAQKSIKALQKEVETLKATLADVSSQAQQVKSLQAEVKKLQDALSKTTASTQSQPKKSSRSTSTRKKKTGPKTSEEA